MGEGLTLPRRPLGSTGLTVSALGLGTVKIGRNQKIKYPTFALPDEAAVLRLLDEALELGINLLDTAPAYGTAEERLGQLLESRRERFVIVTKTGEEFANGESTYNFSAEHTRRSVERSLSRLKVSALDCVLVHTAPNDLECLRDSDALETLRRLKMCGDIRSYGASIATVEGGLYALEHSDVVMVAHSAEHNREESVISRAAELNKGVLIKKGLGSGRLADGSLEEKLQPIFALPGIASLIVGTINLEHLRENVRATIATLQAKR